MAQPVHRHLAIALFAVVVSTACASTQPVAVVDMSRVLLECREGRAAKADLMAEWRADQARLDQRQEALVRTLYQIKAERERGLPIARIARQPRGRRWRN